MSRILIAGDGRWYDELKVVGYYTEPEVERWILQHGKELFPHHFTFPFKREVLDQSVSGSRRPDLALITRDFAAWTIVEIELEGHSLKHVLDQTQVFTEGNYNEPKVAEYLRKQLERYCNKRVSLRRLKKLLSETTPSTLVIADALDDQWQVELKKQGVDLGGFEIYKSTRGHYVYRTSGRYPLTIAQETHCRPDRWAPNRIEVMGDFTFTKLRRGRRVEVVYEGILTHWGFVEDRGKKYLQFMGSSNPLSPNETYTLLRDKSHKYYFKRS
jgi:hypothetical protein